ncbi:class I SAM-dependent methyltransferase [Methanolacinia petrolearia]|uniref:class I SAM-dependent methyltransferase n=1 Tax=Methanolacinia petrolearia TaxID=54120 RepID=UPI003BA93798
MPQGEHRSAAEKAESMARVSRGLFAPAYPAIAGRIKEACGTTEGICIDAGAGSGMLGISLAKITGLEVILMDLLPENRKYAEENIRQEKLDDRCRFVQGDITNMPFEDKYADLVISRGSIFFWDDLKSAFYEILRVLKPGGKTFIGGGFGDAETRDYICGEMAKEDPEWGKDNEDGKKKTVDNRIRILMALEEAEIFYKCISDDSGFWIVLEKQRSLR